MRIERDMPGVAGDQQFSVCGPPYLVAERHASASQLDHLGNHQYFVIVARRVVVARVDLCNRQADAFLLHAQ